MNSLIFRRIILLATLALMLAAYHPDGPDLVPERRTGSQSAEGFCRRDGERTLVVRVRNQSNDDVVDQTTTKVDFSPGGTRTAKTSPMPGGSMSDVSFSIPAACFNPDCDFTITVDSDREVAESHEGNNTESGKCIG